MLTVRELIAKLQKIKDKDLPCMIETDYYIQEELQSLIIEDDYVLLSLYEED